MEGFLAVPLTAGTRLDVGFVVDPPMLTHHVPGQPGLLMTPTLVALIEEVCARIVRPLLEPEAAAVGTWVGVHHTGVAMLGETLTISATVSSMERRRIRYDVTARVDERRVGHGEIGFTLVRSPSASAQPQSAQAAAAPRIPDGPA
jgi:fluoroacetyl-CoA thioesterase